MKELNIKDNNPNEYCRIGKETKLKPYLQKIDIIAAEMEEDLAVRLVKGSGLTEEMRNTDPERWIGLMNNFRNIDR